MIEVSNADLEKLNLDDLTDKSCSTDVLRLDKIHPVISGNKWFKLKYYLEDALNSGKNTIATFGGAWSNHIIATAFAAKINELNAIGIIRGEKPSVFSPTLQYATELGMELIFVPRHHYKERNDAMAQEILNNPEEVYIIPEGGCGAQGVKGAGEILSLIPQGYYSHIMCAVGTGTMFTGLLNTAEKGQQVIGIPVLKGMAALENEYAHLTDPGKKADPIFFYEYHFGGYARRTPELIRFMNEFYHRTRVPTDFVYTGKLMYAFTDLLKKGHFKHDSRILLIHSGGLQGNTSVPAGTLEF